MARKREEAWRACEFKQTKVSAEEIEVAGGGGVTHIERVQRAAARPKTSRPPSRAARLLVLFRYDRSVPFRTLARGGYTSYRGFCMYTTSRRRDRSRVIPIDYTVRPRSPRGARVEPEVRARQPPGQHVAWALGLGAHDRHERRRADSGIARRAPAAGAGESARRARPRGRRMGPGPQRERPHPIHEETGERRAGRRPRAAATKTVRRAPPFSATAGAKRKPITVCVSPSSFRAHLHSDAGGPVVTRSDGTGPADAPFGLASLERQFVAHGRDPDGRDPARLVAR